MMPTTVSNWDDSPLAGTIWATTDDVRVGMQRVRAHRPDSDATASDVRNAIEDVMLFARMWGRFPRRLKPV